MARLSTGGVRVLFSGVEVPQHYCCGFDSVGGLGAGSGIRAAAQRTAQTASSATGTDAALICSTRPAATVRSGTLASWLCRRSRLKAWSASI
jgi:hypothetical protein